jgi:hypothetical protein
MNVLKVALNVKQEAEIISSHLHGMPAGIQTMKAEMRLNKNTKPAPIARSGFRVDHQPSFT